jgi:hypothetical protein
MKTPRLVPRAFLTGALLAAVLTPFALFGQANLQTINFESLTPGPGNLTPTFSTFAYGPASVNGGSGTFISNDPIEGVVASSVLGTGQAGYLGGDGTGVTLNSSGSPSSLGVELFYGSSANNATTTVQMIGSATSLATFSLDFAVHRVSSANQQTFFFNYYDGQNAVGSGFATHSDVSIGSNNEVYIQDNQNSPYIDTGLAITSDTAYHLAISVDYDTATWSASMTTGATTYDLASNRAINGFGYTLSGYTNLTYGFGQVNMYAATSSVSNAAFADQLVFDNLNTTAIPEPGTCAAVAGLAAFGLAVWTRRTRREQSGASFHQCSFPHSS